MPQQQIIAFFTVTGTKQVGYEASFSDPAPPTPPSPPAEQLTGTMSVETTTGTILSFRFDTLYVPPGTTPTSSEYSDGGPNIGYEQLTINAETQNGNNFVGMLGGTFKGVTNPVSGDWRLNITYSGTITLLTKITVDWA